MTQRPSHIPLRQDPGESAYASCLGCGTLIVKVIETTGEVRTHCSVCKEKQGQAAPPMFNLAAQKRPPYEKPPAISPE